MAEQPQAAAATEPQIELDPDLIDDSEDSALGDDVSRYTASLTSSIERYPVENGRRYHAFKDGSYVMPNDESESDRLDLMHQMFRIMMSNKLYFAPIDKPESILDVGTGTGIWAIEMGDDFPDAQILGTDLSATQPTWVPSNVKFEVDDAEQPWTFRTPFDFVHCRYLGAAISDWPQLIKQAFQHTKPGGHAEFQDFLLHYYSEDHSMKPDMAVTQWIDTLIQAAKDFGKDPNPGPKLEGWMKDAGFENVVAQKFRVPIGPWPKDPHLKQVGSFNLVQIEEGLEAFTLRLFTSVLGWRLEEVQVLLANVRKNLRDPKMHAQFDFYVVYGQKPMTVET